MPLNKDFAKIKRNMLKEYGKGRGERIYHAWVNKHGYDDTKSMAAQAKERGRSR
jgi:hypothetical protein